MGHRVTLNDLSEDVLEIALQKLPASQNLTIQRGEIQSLSPALKYDLVICHAVLEWLQSPLDVITHLVDKLKPEGYLSLSFFNKDAHRFGNLLYGNFDYVKADLKNKNTVRLNPNNSVEPKAVLVHLQCLPVNLVHRAGIRCIHDYMKHPDMQISHYQQVKEMEITYGTKEPYLWLGKYFHLIVQRKPG